MYSDYFTDAIVEKSDSIKSPEDILYSTWTLVHEHYQNFPKASTHTVRATKCSASSASISSCFKMSMVSALYFLSLKSIFLVY